MIKLAIWLYDTTCSTTRAFWIVACSETEQSRLYAVLDGVGRRASGAGVEIHRQPIDEARKITRDAITDNRLEELYPGWQTPSDAQLLDYWNYANDELVGSSVTLDEFCLAIEQFWPRPQLRVVRP